MADAIAAASTADVAIVFGNDGESEGQDRTSLALSDSSSGNWARPSFQIAAAFSVSSIFQ